MHHDGTAAEGVHCITETVTGSCLDDVFHELGTVAVEPLPFLCAADAFVGYTIAAKLVSANLGLYIGKLPTGRKNDKEHPALAGELNAVGFIGVLIAHSLH